MEVCFRPRLLLTLPDAQTVTSSRGAPWRCDVNDASRACSPEVTCSCVDVIQLLSLRKACQVYNMVVTFIGLYFTFYHYCPYCHIYLLPIHCLCFLLKHSVFILNFTFIFYVRFLCVCFFFLLTLLHETLLFPIADPWTVGFCHLHREHPNGTGP